MSGYALYPPRPQFFDDNGHPLTSGTLEVFLSGTSDHADLFSDIDLATPIANPVDLNSRGEPATAVFAAYGIPLKLELRDELDVLVYTVDPFYLLMGSGGIAFATNAETDTGSVTTKAVQPAAGAYAYDRLRHAGQHTAGKSTASVAIAIAAGTATPNCALSNVFEIAADQNFTLANPTNPLSGQTMLIRIRQDATGGRTVTLGSKYRFANGTAPTFSTAANAVDLLSLAYDVTDAEWDCTLNTAMAVPA